VPIVEKRRAALILMLILCSVLVAIPNILTVRASETIYIRADGTVEGTDKIQRDGNVYTFTDKIVNQSIVVEKDNIVVDGAGYTLEGDGRIESIWLENRCNVTIKNMQITHFGNGIWIMGNCKNNTIIGNTITDIGHETAANGIWVSFGASNNTISGNNITNNYVGIYVYMGGGNIISENYITANWGAGVWIAGGSNRITRNDIINNGVGVSVLIGGNIIYHNNFVNNNVQAGVNEEVNIWDDGYPSGGNYWSNYNGTDNDGDGIGDTPYVIDENNQDNYPLVNPTIIPEFPSLIPLLIMLFSFTLIAVIYRRTLHKPNHRKRMN